jgi:hypothetical protein
MDGAEVFVCENPNIVAIAADSLGSDCGPTALHRRAVVACWDTQLTESMSERGLAIPEEFVADTLLNDLTLKSDT